MSFHQRRRRRLAAVLASFALLAGTAGCATQFTETHFFKSQNAPGDIPNYFRLRVSGSTGLTSARYLSGYFDEDIVNQYFNEIGQPEKARLVPVGQAPKPDEGKSGDTKSTAKNPALILLLSSNSDDIANQIGALAQSQEFTASLAALVAGPRFAAANAAEGKLRNDDKRGKVAAELGDKLISGLPAKATRQQIESQLLQYVNQVSREMGAPAFADLGMAATWLRDNRARLLAEFGQ